MSDINHQAEWREKTLSYVSGVNEFIASGLRDGWENAGKEPEEPGRDHLAEIAMAEVRRANATGEIANLRDRWPPAHAPLIELLESKGQSIPVVLLLHDGSILARIGSTYEAGQTAVINGDTVTELAETGMFGRCPNRRYFGIARDEGIEITDGWGGDRVAMCPWPTGLEDVPEGFKVAPLEEAPNPTRIIPFPDGRRVLFVSAEGIFVLSPTGARRLLPTKEEMKEHFEWSLREYPDDDLEMHLSMEHGAVSVDGKMIAVGSQDSTHLLFNEDLELIGNVGNRSEYPHYAVFSADGSVVAFNSCHFYNGITIGVPTALFPGLETEPYEEDDLVGVIEEGARVYAAASRGDEFIIGDANGYAIGVSQTGELRWRQFIGSSVGDIDVSADGKKLAVSTYAGFIALFDLDAGEQAPHQIGTGQHYETRRWIFWKGEEPMIW